MPMSNCGNFSNQNRSIQAFEHYADLTPQAPASSYAQRPSYGESLLNYNPTQQNVDAIEVDWMKVPPVGREMTADEITALLNNAPTYQTPPTDGSQPSTTPPAESPAPVVVSDETPSGLPSPISS